MKSETILSGIGVIVALSGWFKVYIDHLANRPKLAGRILLVFKGNIEINGTQYTSCFLYPYIVNLRKNEAHILDYELYYKKKWYSRWTRVKRGYGFAKTENLKFSSNQGEPITINRFRENLIFNKGGIAKHGIPLHGWIPFLGEKNLYQINEYKHKLVCIDAFGRRHSIIQSRDRQVSLYLVMEIAEISLPQHMFPT